MCQAEKLLIAAMLGGHDPKQCPRCIVAAGGKFKRTGDNLILFPVDGNIIQKKDYFAPVKLDKDFEVCFE